MYVNNKFKQYSLFVKLTLGFVFNKLHTSTELCKKYCKERIEALVGVCMCFLKLRINTMYCTRFMVNNIFY